MTPDKKQAATAESAIQWLEGQLEGSKIQLRLLEQHVEEATNLLLSLSDSVRKVEETLSSITATVAAAPALQEELRQVKEQLANIQNRSDDLARRQQADLEHDRHDRSAVAKQVGVIDKLVGRYENRLQGIEETARHIEEKAAALRKGEEQVGQTRQELLAKASSSRESINRLEHERDRLANEAEILRQADHDLADRVNLSQEVVHRIEERVDQMEQQLPTIEEIREFQKGSRFEREQFAERVTKAERHSEEADQRSQEFGQLIAAFQQQDQAQASQILSLVEEVREHRQQVGERLKRLAVMMERQKRRQAEALAQEVKELKQSGLDASDQ